MLSLRAGLAGSLLLVTTVSAQSSSVSTTTWPDTTAAGLKNPGIARLIGIVPGAGHMYAGEVGRGFLYLGGTLGILTVGSALWMNECFMTDQPGPCGETTGAVTLIATGGLWLWSIVDAGRAARRTNAKRIGSTSLILEPTRIPVTAGDDRTAVRLGLRITTR
jgi:hypothetical protein